MRNALLQSLGVCAAWSFACCPPHGQQPEYPAPQPPPAELPRGWEAIDGVPLEDCAVNCCQMLPEVPQQHTTAYARAHVAVHELILAALEGGGTALELERALKWRLALDAVLLRAQIRGGRRGARQFECGGVAWRFSCWAQGDMGTLVRRWRTEAAVWRRR